ncbi:hypothetical protein RJ640_006321 [Escallonia rubra]|uniref:Uncharacterized protein n=1 Tax=Escallonia rubra TaxID=112253 RepID=A0AA88UPI7_9ASTE|nr:hypothetical protein RJ640_006321 [Escallonia rubra]
MAVSRSTVAAMAVFAALVGAAVAAEAPAPSPTSAAGSISPSLAVGCAFAVVGFLFGSVGFDLSI